MSIATIGYGFDTHFPRTSAFKDSFLTEAEIKLKEKLADNFRVTWASRPYVPSDPAPDAELRALIQDAIEDAAENQAERTDTNFAAGDVQFTRYFYKNGARICQHAFELLDDGNSFLCPPGDPDSTPLLLMVSWETPI